MASGSGWNQWVCLAGGGCGCKEVYRVPLITYPYTSCICSFCSIPTFCSFLKMFFVLVTVLFVNYVIIFSCSLNTHMGDYGRPTEAI